MADTTQNPAPSDYTESDDGKTITITVAKGMYGAAVQAHAARHGTKYMTAAVVGIPAAAVVGYMMGKKAGYTEGYTAGKLA